MLIWAGLAAALFPASPSEAGCPALLDGATRLVLVTTPTMNGATATLETFERASATAPWQVRTGPQPAVVGEAGLGWGLTFHDVAEEGEPIKEEGDRRAPAGIFPLGPAFGFSASTLPGYVQIEPGVQICVDDPNSPYYSQIVTRQQAGEGVSGEDMGAITLYRRGLVVDYPTSGKAKSGSCIFIHIWLEPGHGTVGCVAVREATVADLQAWAGRGGAAMAILPEGAKGRFACLP